MEKMGNPRPDADYYMGDHQIMDLRVDDKYDVSYGILGDNPAFQKLIQGLGIALGAVDMLKDDIAAGRLVVPLDAELNPDCAYYLVRPEGRPERPSAKAFRQWLREEARPPGEGRAERPRDFFLGERRLRPARDVEAAVHVSRDGALGCEW